MHKKQMRHMTDLVHYAKSLEQKTLVVAVAQDEHVLEAVEMARKDGFIHAILVGDQQAIETICDAHHIPLESYEVIDEKDVAKACQIAVSLVAQQKNHYLMKGIVDTSIILKAALDKEEGLRTKNRLSHVSVMEIPTYHKLLLMSDGAMNIDPDVEIKQEIIENGNQIAHAIGIEKPNVAIIAAVEKINPKMQATLDAQILIERNQKGAIKNCVIGGPFALDNAINQEAAMHKGIKDPMAGDVDFLLMPQIESGNVFYKSMMFLANAKSASVIAGAKKPIVLTSRADSKESKYYSIALGALVTEITG